MGTILTISGYCSINYSKKLWDNDGTKSKATMKLNLTPLASDLFTHGLHTTMTEFGCTSLSFKQHYSYFFPVVLVPWFLPQHIFVCISKLDISYLECVCNHLNNNLYVLKCYLLCCVKFIFRPCQSSWSEHIHIDLWLMDLFGSRIIKMEISSRLKRELPRT